VKSGDTIKHRPTGENWVVAAMSPDGKELVCAGWPETVTSVENCELVKSCSDAEHREMLIEVTRTCAEQLRGSWARKEMES
jgi:hypothetical protein